MVNSECTIRTEQKSDEILSSQYIVLYDASESNMVARGYWLLAAVICAEKGAGLLPRIRLAHDFDFPPHMSTHRHLS